MPLADQQSVLEVELEWRAQNIPTGDDSCVVNITLKIRPNGWRRGVHYLLFVINSQQATLVFYVILIFMNERLSI